MVGKDIEEEINPHELWKKFGKDRREEEFGRRRIIRLLPLVVATIISLCVPAISGYELLENESLIAKPIKVNLFVEK